ncbi:MAG: Gfo/Idh/MocA family oxidoreductase [Ruminococcaceae bacterium]|nr:Gfo/Idh/MocA family oxidoreductase [Oscillospiraceae bacterium]
MANRKLTVAFVGCGRFAKYFVPLFKVHPFVEKVYACDLIKEKAEEYSEKFNIEIIDTYEEILSRSDINCVINFTQRHLHGDIVIRALKAGKHVYSAVPMASKVEECKEIVELVEKTGLIYLMGETCYYYPCAMYCREAYKDGKFGDFAYGASQYYHHINDIGYGKIPEERGMPPLLYPTHSTAMIISAVNSYVKKVTCVGFKDTYNDKTFIKENNIWNNDLINQYVLMELANGGTARVTEARGFGWGKPSSYISALYGTKGSYEFSNAQHILVEKDLKSVKEKVQLTDVSDYVNPSEMTANKHLPDFKNRVANAEWQWDVSSPIQQKEFDRLPKEFKGLPNGHMGTHKLIVDDFCKAAYSGEQPTLNAWQSARYTVPGLVAIESAKKGGIPLEVPDFGDGK